MRDAGGSSSRVTLQDCTVRLGRRTVLDRINLHLDDEIVALVGPNGAGKSTLLRVLATLQPIDSGEVMLDGHAIATRSGARRARASLGYLPQEPQFPRNFTVSESIVYAAWLHKISAARRSEVADSIMETLGLREYGEMPLSKLSGGTRRRVHIAQALVHDPRVLLIDEPTVGIDAEHRVEFRRQIRKIAPGRVVILSTHLTEDIELLADRVVALESGSVRFDGDPGALAKLGADATSAEGSDDERSVERALRILGGTR